ncbi:MAG: polysaccharide biosynthesis tyrosine autokinase [Deltaproteobacteria bacterium]|nr:polysaccharide biosynthesis tyrosine autokinase [Deltaproteobacteria bacterium]
MSIDKPVPRNYPGAGPPSREQSISPAGYQPSPYVFQSQSGERPYGPDDNFADSNRSLKDYLDIILRRRAAVLIFLAASLVISVLYCSFATPLYTSKARLEVLDKKEKTEKKLSGEEAVDTRSYMSTQIEILKSRPIAEAVVTRMNLLEKDDSASSSFSLFKVPVYLWQTISSWFKSDSDSDQADDKKAQKLAVLADSLAGSIVAKPVKTSNLLEVSIAAKSPQKANELLTNYIDAYIASNLQKRRSESIQAEQWLKDEGAKVEKNLREAESKLLDFCVDHGLVVATEGALGQVMSLLNKKIEGQVHSEESKMKAKVQKETKYAVPETMSQGSNQTYIGKLKEDLAKQEAEYTEMQGVYSSNYPKMVLQQRKIKFLQNRIAEIEKNLATGAVESAEKVEAAMKGSVEETKQEIARVKGLEAEYSILKKDVDTNSEFLKLILKEGQEMGIKARTISNNMIVADPPTLPRAPSWPKKKLILLIGLLFGLVGGVGVAFIWEQMDDTLQNPDHLSRSLNVRRLGIVPDVSKTGTYDENELSEGVVEFLAYNNPKTPIADAIRNLQMSILFSYPDYPIRCLSISSSLPSEGKTMMAVSFASVLCSGGSKRTVVVDMDMRKPRIHSVFRVPPSTPGMSNLLNGNGNAMLVSDVIHAHTIPGFYYITSGPVPSDSVSLLHSHNLKNVMDELRSTFDYVVIDCPPILGFPDTPILTRFTDGLVVVARQGYVGKNEITEAIDQVSSVDGANILGVVFNRAHAPALYGYGYKYGYRYGGHYYHQSYKYYHNRT